MSSIRNLVIGELACGSLSNRQEILRMLKILPEAEVAEHDAVLRFPGKQKLHGCGLGWVEASLLVSTLLPECSLWTFDKPLRRAAAALNVLA